MFELIEFLRAADLTTVGLDDADLHLWIDVDADGRIAGSTGFELVGTHALIRSVAVAQHLRGEGRGLELARFALDQATALGATQAWLFSRRSGEFWHKLGFDSAAIPDLVAAVGSTSQVRAFVASGQVNFEVAYSRPL
jgi:N-acetylglutamate synthase-like GNAT family acetyltransferase